MSYPLRTYRPGFAAADICVSLPDWGVLDVDVSVGFSWDDEGLTTVEDLKVLTERDPRWYLVDDLRVPGRLPISRGKRLFLLALVDAAEYEAAEMAIERMEEAA